MSLKPITPKLNFLVSSKSKTKPLPKMMNYLFIFFQVAFALDFGFINCKSPKGKKYVKLISLGQATSLIALLSYLLLYAHPTKFTAWYLADVVIYYVAAVTLWKSKNTYYDFQVGLHSFDAEIGDYKYSCKVEYKILFVFILLFVFRGLLSTYYCFYFREYCIVSTEILCSYYIAMLGNYAVLISYAFLFQSVSYRIKNFMKFVSDVRNDVISSQYLYKNIVDITEKVKKTFDIVMVLVLVFNTVDVTLTVFVEFSMDAYGLLVVGLVYVTVDVTLSIYLPFTEDGTMPGYTVHMPLAYLFVVQELTMMFAPAFTAGLVSSQVDRLRLVMYDRLVKDPRNAKDIKRFISYIDARPLRFKVWMVIPLDWSLPVIIINISVTYLIVMIQFTHKN